MVAHSFRYLFVCLLVLAAVQAGAAWQENGFIPDPDAVPGYSIECTSDGQGGMIVVWEDVRDGDYHIYAQRIDDWGNALWTSGGIPVCTYASGDQDNPVIASDGSGGAYIAWEDVTDSGIYNIFAQHLNSDGLASWAANGIPLASGSPTRATDLNATDADDGSSYIVWEQTTSATYSIQAMRLTPAGKAWTTSLQVTTDTSYIIKDPLVTNVLGGAAIVWLQYFEGTGYVLNDCIVDPSGTYVASPSWTSYNGNSQTDHAIATSSTGGFFVVWRQGTTDIDLYYAYFSGDGAFGNMNRVLCDAAEAQSSPQLVTTDNGIIVTWLDYRNDEDNIYGQLISLGMAEQWTANGRPICTTDSDKYLLGLVSDGDNGALQIWSDDTIGYGLRAQRILNSGYTAWNSSGVPLTATSYRQQYGSVISDGAGGLLATWYVSTETPNQLAVQRLDRTAHWGYAAPEMATVEDIPGDQGGKVLVSWGASYLDPWPHNEIEFYTVWRALPGEKSTPAVNENWATLLHSDRPDTPIIRAETTNAKTTYWEMVESVDAFHMAGYSKAIATHNNHTATNEGLHLFQVMAHGNSTGEYWTSRSAEGWSVDNLAPGALVGLTGTGTYSPEGLDLSWNANTETDLRNYVVHRGLTLDFIPSDATLVAAPSDTTLFDTGWDAASPWFYKVAAVDRHDNVGEFAVLAPNALVGVEETVMPSISKLHGNHPNPFNPSTTINYALATPENVRLQIYDTAGRLVRTLVNETQAAGQRQAVWNGRDDGGRQVSSGVYLYRLQAGDLQQTRRMTLVK